MLPKVRKEDLDKFNKSDIGMLKNKYLKRATISGILCIMFGLLFIIYNVYTNQALFEYIIPIVVILFGIYYIIRSNIIKRREVNKYIYELKKLKGNL